jgi:hypothetical protein
MHLPFTPAIETSMIKHDGDLVGDAGDYTVTTVWTSGLPPTDRRFHMQLVGWGDWLHIETAGISVTNLSMGSAAAYWPVAMPGYVISQELTKLDDNYAAPEVVRYDAVPVNPWEVTGPILLRVAFDDTTNHLTTSFSLDGGATFQSPFTAMPLFRFGGIVDHELYAGAAAVQTGPVPQPTQYVDLRGFEVKQSSSSLRKVKWHAKEFNVPFHGNPTEGGATLNLRVDGVTQCFRMPASGWEEQSYGRYRYVDQYRVHGPVRRARVGGGLKGSFEAKIEVLGPPDDVMLAPPNPGTQMDANLEVAGLTDYCSTSTGGRIRANDAKTFKVQSAPSPASCAVSACSP